MFKVSVAENGKKIDIYKILYYGAIFLFSTVIFSAFYSIVQGTFGQNNIQSLIIIGLTAYFLILNECDKMQSFKKLDAASICMYTFFYALCLYGGVLTYLSNAVVVIGSVALAVVITYSNSFVVKFFK